MIGLFFPEIPLRARLRCGVDFVSDFIVTLHTSANKKHLTTSHATASFVHMGTGEYLVGHLLFATSDIRGSLVGHCSGFLFKSTKRHRGLPSLVTGCALSRDTGIHTSPGQVRLKFVQT